MRLVTRGDLDGLTAAVLISEMEQVDEILLVHPQDITDHKVAVTANDILANLPFDPRCGMWFDHHAHTVMPSGEFRGAYKVAPSVARVVYEHYAAPRLLRFEKLVRETDRFDSADLTRDDVLDPQGAILLGFLVDPRTGMGGDYRAQFADLVRHIREKGVAATLADPDLRAMAERYHHEELRFRDFLKAHTVLHDTVIVTDCRETGTAPVGNRFLVYALYPEGNVSLRIAWGPEKKFVALNIGHSIFNRTCTTDVGEICRNYGGGGHRGAGACTLRPAGADLAIKVVIRKLQKG